MQEYPMKISILGTTYTIHEIESADDVTFESFDVDGYTDCSTHEIILRKKDKREPFDYANTEFERKKILRHEIIHAFFFESGLGFNSHSADAFAVDEELIDWIAAQFPKMVKAFAEVKCL
ncbi:MAG: hypothetical protein RR547_05865 [Raoultibacter sp.]